jgi:hypothetical protein
MTSQPKLNVRAAAEMLGRPIDKRLSQLRRQKYPTAGPGFWMVPYYGPAKRAMRSFFHSGPAALTDARAKFQSLSQESRRANNERVLSSFESSDFSKRPLKPVPIPRLTATIEGIAIKLSPDFLAVEAERPQYFYVNFCHKQYQYETALCILEIAHFVLTYNGLKVAPDQLHFVDLFEGKTYDISIVREKTIRTLRKDAKDILEVWPDL